MTGEWQVEDLENGTSGATFRTSGKVGCFLISDDGKTAFLGGKVQQSDFSGPSFPVRPGSDAIWTVVDNGNSGARSDRASDLTFGIPVSLGSVEQHCADGTGRIALGAPPPDVDIVALESGNIDVRP